MGVFALPAAGPMAPPDRLACQVLKTIATSSRKLDFMDVQGPGAHAMDRQSKLNWMRDILDHLRSSYEQWSMADAQSEHYLAETMKRDLDEFRRLCDSLRGGERSLRSVRAA